MPAPFTYVIEHMESDESDGTFPPWVSLEYTQMLVLASSPSPAFAPTSTPAVEGTKVVFSSLSPTSTASLPGLLQGKLSSKGTTTTAAKFEATSKPILELLASSNPPVPISRVCLLDPRAPQELSPADGDEFDYFLFGGILGDDPPRDRTGELRKLGFPGRHLLNMQMTTDTALGVTKIVVQDKVPLSQIPFLDHPTITFNSQESVEMPFRYVNDGKGEPVLPDGMRELLEKDMDRGFDVDGDDF